MFYVCPKGPIERALRDSHVNYISLDKLNVKNMNRLIKKHKPDIIHAHDKFASVVCALSRGRFTLISHIHGTFVEFSRVCFKSIIYLLCSFRFKKLVFVSFETANSFVFKNILKSKMVVLSNVIDATSINDKLSSDNNNYDIDVIFLGRLTFVKDPLRFVSIMGNVIKKKKDIKIAIVGNGVLYDDISEMIISNGFENDIKLYGFMSNPFKILKCSKLLCMTSKSEGTPMVALEAMALGVPIVSTPVDGMNMLVKNGFNGFLSDDDSELEDKVLEILNNSCLRDFLSSNSIDVFMDINNIDNYKRVLMEMYSD
ncbi:MAG: glycosyltransferase [Bacilli bacterium]|nr:glycosyltransferase [Bacilli bacterium]